MNTIDGYVELLARGKAFSFTKLNHGFWERIVRLRQLTGGTLSLQEITSPAKLDAKTGPPCFLETGFFEELRAMVRTLPVEDESFFFASSVYSWPACRRIEGTPVVGIDRARAVMEEMVPAGALERSELIWKDATISGEIARLFHALKDRRVVLIGPPRLAHFGEFAGIQDFTHLSIHQSRARYDREEILGRIVAEHRADVDLPTVYMFQAGSLSTWLVLRLHGRLLNACLLDLGGILNVCSIDTLLNQNWSRVFRTEVARTVTAVHPAWEERSEAYEKPTTPAERRGLWLELTRGIEPRIAALTNSMEQRTLRRSLVPVTETAGHVEFVERKTPDWGRVRALLSISEEQNHWANGGPLSCLLEAAISAFLELPPERAVVMCSSATTALNALVGAHTYRAGHPLRWVAPAFGFFSTALGPLADAVLLDCDEQGLLDLEALQALDPKSYDALIVTNTFGLHPDWQPFVGHCRELGKVLLYDNAMGLVGCDRSAPDAPDEIVSFHHTKPWGVGEGGCAIVSRNDEALVRAHINFGVSLEERARPYSLNGKISDFACAFILERLETIPWWSKLYDMQRRRIQGLGEDLGLQPLTSRLPRRNPMGNVPMLHSEPISTEAVRAERFTMRKYYRPLTPAAPVAARLFERIVNIPCHPGMATIPTDEIFGTLERVLGNPGRAGATLRR